MTKIRESLGMTKYGLAKELGITTSAIYQYEGSAKSIRLDILSKLRKISGLSWNQIGKMIDDEFPGKEK